MGNYHPLNLIRPLKDLNDLSIPHHPFKWMISRKTLPLQDLNGFGRYFHGDVRGEIF